MNYFLVFFLVLLILEVTVSTVLKYVVYSLPKEDDMWYIPNKNFTDIGATPKGVIQDTFSFLVIYNYIIPISLYVTLEVQKFFGILFLEWDDEIKCKDTGERAKANTSDLNEELGQVQYLFTDKTGTLTENIMYFRHCTVNGVKYVNVNDNIQMLDEQSNTSTPLSFLPYKEPRYRSECLTPFGHETIIIVRHASERHRLFEPRGNGNIAERSFGYSAPRIYNKLPFIIKHSESVEKFKKTDNTSL
ncbi:putative phospholipid-transporting ATPase IF [Halocaridina rubra]|uniref:Phospholipid-transporting ATPase IF n=1 Tax=Halocaridina rubra TaxID=373956 RepID=A0AAN8X7I5_HALRR